MRTRVKYFSNFRSYDPYMGVPSRSVTFGCNLILFILSRCHALAQLPPDQLAWKGLFTIFHILCFVTRTERHLTRQIKCISITPQTCVCLQGRTRVLSFCKWYTRARQAFTNCRRSAPQVFSQISHLTLGRRRRPYSAYARRTICVILIDSYQSIVSNFFY